MLGTVLYEISESCWVQVIPRNQTTALKPRSMSPMGMFNRHQLWDGRAKIPIH